MALEDVVAWFVVIVWTLTSIASVVFAYYGLRVKKPLCIEAKRDLEAIEETSPLYRTALLMQRAISWLYRVQQAFFVHQSLFLIAGLCALGLRYFAPVVYTEVPEDLNFVKILRSIFTPTDLVLAQLVIVIGQVFLHGVGKALRELYHIKVRGKLRL